MTSSPQGNGLKHENGKQNGKMPKKDFFKKPRVRCSANKRTTVLRDKACRRCGSRNELSAHHIIFVGEGGDDSFRNLITLCFDCHRKAHDGHFVHVEPVPYYVSPKDFILYTLNRLNDKLYEQTILEVEKKP